MQLMNIKDRLRELDRVQQKNKPPIIDSSTPATRATPDDIFSALFKALDGDGHDRPQQLSGDGCLILEHRTPLTNSIGSHLLNDLSLLSPEFVAIAGKDDHLKAIDLRQTLFIDTETTGLAGGAGTVAFLVGVGYLSGEAFIVRQYFMRDFHEEEALLRLLAKQVDGASGIVSFNGRSFDIPLLNSRYIMHRRRAVFDGIPHFDVLFAARRLWRDTVVSCSLGELEKSILGIRRAEDVPGALVPQIYFDYLQTGALNGLREVFLHNRQDILSMAVLVIRLCHMIQDPLVSTTTPERHRVGTLLRRVRQFERSAEVFENLVEKERQAQTIDTFAELAWCYRRLRRYDEACKLWQRALEKLSFHPLPYLELAKHYEHRLKDFDQALELTERALRAIALREELRGETEIHRLDLEKRRQRLQRKISSQEKWRSS
jgi:hypothetical protein